MRLLKKMIKVFIDGQEGTTGLKIVERIENRNDVELIRIKAELRKDVAERKKLINQSDITFLCLPDISAIEAVSLVENDNVKIIDASTAHRTNNDWAYGFAELSKAHREKIRKSNRVAVPGCHASGFLALVYPLISSGIMPKDYPLVCNSITGYSGGGKKMIKEYESIDRDYFLNSPRQYGLTQMHKHLKEMTHIGQLKFNPIFNPIVADYYSGMQVTVPIFSKLLNKCLGVNDIYNLFKKHYKNQQLFEVCNMGNSSYLPANMMSGSDRMKVLIGGNDERVLLTALFDNLGKGASGGAVQCMNIMLGIDESTSLK